MLTVKPLKSAARAAEYYEAAFQYYANDSQAIRWLGEGAEILNLKEVTKETMLALLVGELPSGQILQNKEGKHRPGFDMTFSAPKSFSLLALLRPELKLELISYHERMEA